MKKHLAVRKPFLPWVRLRPIDTSLISEEGATFNKPRLLLLIRSLNRGGAERQLVVLACGLCARGWNVSVAQFYAGGPWEDELRHAGVMLYDLEKRGRWDVLGFLFRFGRLLWTQRPTILHGYLCVPNLLVALVRPLLPGTRIVWGVRASNMDLSHYDWLAKLTFFLECKTASFADLIVVNSCAGRDYCLAHGYPRHRMLAIPNGIDTERFQFDAEGRRQLRAEWRIGAETVLIGLVGRLDPMKDHSTFFRAVVPLVHLGTQCQFVCVGDGQREYAQKLRQEARALGLDDRLIWDRGRDDMAAVYSAFDIACSSSCSEGFPNVVAEAMACGRPPVVTDVGDSAVIVGETGLVVPSSDASALASALTAMLRMSPEERGELGKRARRRVIDCFSITQLLDATECSLTGVVTRARGST